VNLFVDISKYFFELLREVVVVSEDLLRKLLALVVIGVTKEVLKYRLELLEGLSFEARGYESNLIVFSSKLLRIVLEIGLYLDQKSSKAFLTTSILSRYLELGLDHTNLKLCDLGIGLGEGLLELRNRNG